MKKSMKFAGLVLGASALMTLGGNAFASATWNFSSTNPTGTAGDGCQAQTTGNGHVAGYAQQATNSGTFGNSYKCKTTDGIGPDVTVTAWGRNGTSGFQVANVSPQGSSGFGIKSQAEGLSVSSPDHAMDNNESSGITPDLFLLSFASAVSLSEVVLGWTSSDVDFTLMAYSKPGDASAAPLIQGKTANNLTSGGASAGWILVENSGDPAPDSASGSSSTDIPRSVNNGTPAVGNTPAKAPVTSSWWLISAYNSGFGGGTLDNLPDYMKLLSVSSRVMPTTGVPEPGSMALMGLALAGMVALRRRQTQ